MRYVRFNILILMRFKMRRKNHTITILHSGKNINNRYIRIRIGTANDC